MLPSQLSLNIILMAIIPIILIFYAILLIKLRPSNETKSPLNGHSEKMKKPPIEPKRPEKLTPVKAQKTLKEPAEDAQTQVHVQTEEKPKEKKDKEAKKSFFLFGERNFEGCLHKFGYLSSLPKNTPIPDECFGCSQIVECLRASKIK